MAETVVITQSGSSITIYPNNYYTKDPGEYWCFSVNVERYRYKNEQPLIRYNAEIVAERIDFSNQNTEKIVIIRFNRSGSLQMLDKAHTLLKSLLQTIDNGDPVWDVRELI